MRPEIDAPITRITRGRDLEITLKSRSNCLNVKKFRFFVRLCKDVTSVTYGIASLG